MPPDPVGRRSRLLSRSTGAPCIDASVVDPRLVETNLVRVEVKKSGKRAAQWSADLKHKGVLVSPCDIYALRFVTHRHIAAADIDATLSAFADLWKKI